MKVKSSSLLLSNQDAKLVQDEAGKTLVRWVRNSSPHEYDPDWSEDSDIRQLKAAYTHGYNDCRTELLQEIADIVLEGFQVHTSEDEDEDDDSY